jgi:TonB dependent receptor/CarboxypepD_reg-like domain/TonB-dependent Receptor Plug Domain
MNSTFFKTGLIMKRLFFLFLLMTGACMVLHAQQTAYIGLVADEKTGEPLPGATVTISGPRELKLLSGLNGTFNIKKLTDGTYTVKVFYTGYRAYEATINVTGGKVPGLRISLERNQKEMTAVRVSAKREKGSELSAMLTDRKADIVQNSVSARTIEISPDLSVANVSQRISGVSLERSTNGEGQYAIVRGMDKRYIYTLVNGIKIPSPDNKNRYVPLDIFPADLLDRLEVTKSLTPNKEGDAIGGAINMIMKDAPKQFSLKANAALGYADKFFTQDFTRFSSSQSADRSPRYTNGPGYQATMNNFRNSAFTYSTRHNPLATVAGLSIGDRFFGDKLGVLVAGSFQNSYRNVNSTFFGTETDRNNGNASVTSIESRNYSIQQQRSGIHTKLDYHINEKNKLKAYAGYMNLLKNEFRAVSDTNLQLGRVGPGTGRISNTYRTFHEVQKIFNVMLNGEHEIGNNFSADWTVSWSKATGNRPDEARLTLVTGVSKDPSTGNLVQAPLNLDASSSRQFTHSTDEDKSGYLNFNYDASLGTIKTRWSIGGMYRDKTKSSDFDVYNLRPTNPSIQVYDGDISHNTFSVFNGEGTSDNALNYSAEEKVGAAYTMLKIDFKALEITGGARYENTDLTWTSNVPESVKGKTGTITYYDVLPSAHIKYTLNKRNVLRASYYSAISRPNFYEVVPHTGGDPDADYNEIGNPNLKRTTADNFDVRYEYFPKGLDQLLAGVFYKRLNNPIEYALEDVGTNTYYLPDNFGNASNYGFEVDVTKYLQWFGIRANYTFTNSQITTTKTKRYSTSSGQTNELVNQTRPLQGQSKHIANLSLLLKDDNKTGLNAQLAVGYTSRRINTVSQFLNNDIWQKGFVQMDFSIEKKLSKQWFIYTKINNLLNTPYELEIRQPYAGNGAAGDVPHQQVNKNVFVRKDTYGASYLLGVKLKL